MFYSSGYFKHIDCPFLVSGLCERHYCHFRHSNFVKVESFSSQIIENDAGITAYSFGDNYFSSITDSEYNPVDFVSEVKPSYSPACNLTVISPNNKSTQSIQTETISEFPYEPISVDLKQNSSNSKPESALELDECSTIPNKEAPELSPLKSKKEKSPPINFVKVKKKKVKTKQLERDPIQESLLIEQKAQVVRDIIKSIFDSSSDDSSTEHQFDKVKSNKLMKRKVNREKFDESPSKKKKDRDGKPQKPDNSNMAVSKPQKPDSSKVAVSKPNITVPAVPVKAVEDQFTEMEQALITGRFRGRRLTTIEILKFRRELADRDRR